MSATEVLRTAFLAAAALGATLAHAQAPVVTDADIERAKRNQPVVTDADIERARERHRTPSDAELRQAPVPSTPRIDALPKPVIAPTIDLGALAGGFDATGGQPGLAPNAGPTVMVFVSFSMPDAALTRLVDQASRSDATLVLRGLVGGSLTQTAARVQQLIGARRVAVQIDPQAFDRYGVKLTPSFVLVRDGARAGSCASGICVPGDGFVMAVGDVSLDYALGFFRRSAPAFARDAESVLKRLQPSKTGLK